MAYFHRDLTAGDIGYGYKIQTTGNGGSISVSRSNQNTVETIHANGVPSSVTINASRTNGNRAFVDNQSTFVVGEVSNLYVGTVENTGAVIGKEGNSTFKIDTYVGKDIQNHDTMTTTRGSIGELELAQYAIDKKI